MVWQIKRWRINKDGTYLTQPKGIATEKDKGMGGQLGIGN